MNHDCDPGAHDDCSGCEGHGSVNVSPDDWHPREVTCGDCRGTGCAEVERSDLGACCVCGTERNVNMTHHRDDGLRMYACAYCQGY